MRSSPPLFLLALLLATATTAACDGDPGGDPTPDGDPVPSGECGGRTGVTCAADQFCDYGPNSCGATDETGRCMPRPASCPPLLIPERTCGCDGIIYSSACEATLAGTDLDQSGSCRVDPGAFACGYRQCNLGTQYCRRDGSDIGGEPDAFTCNRLPSCPAGASCTCLASQPCGSRCTGDAAGGLTLTCPGG